MALEVIEYSYVPTAPRKKTKYYTKFDGKWHSTTLANATETAHPSATAAAAAAGLRKVDDSDPRVEEEIRTTYVGNEESDLPTVEEILYAELQKDNHVSEDASAEHAVMENSLADRGGLVSGESLGTTQNPIYLEEDESASSVDFEVDYSDNSAGSIKPDGGLRGDLNSGISMFVSGDEECHDFKLPGPRISLESVHVRDSPSGPPPERLCNRSRSLSMSSLFRSGGQSPRGTSLPSRSLREAKSHPHTHQSTLDEGQLHCPTPGGDTLDEYEQRQRQSEGEDQQLQQWGKLDTVNSVPKPNEDHDMQLLGEEDRSKSPVPRQGLLLGNPPSEPSQGELQLQSDSDENSYTIPDKKETKMLPAKRKRQSKHDFGSAPKKLSRGCQSRGKAQLPSPSCSASEVMDTKKVPECKCCSMPSKDNLAVTKITFYPHSRDRQCFEAEVQTSHNRPDFFLERFSKLLEDIGYVGDATVAVVKPLSQETLVLKGFSRYIPTRLLHNNTTTEISRKGSRTNAATADSQIWRGASVGYGTSASISQEATLSPSCSDSDSSVSDFDAYNDADSSGCEQDALDAGKNTTWSELDEQRLLTWRKEGKSWSWIFDKFRGRTRNAVRARFTIAKKKEAKAEAESRRSRNSTPQSKPRRGRPRKRA